MLGSIFKQRSHYVYNYKPRYYDPRKERLKGADSEAEGRITFNKSNLRSKWARAKKSSADRNVNIRLAVIIAILVGIVAYIFELHTLI